MPTPTSGAREPLALALALSLVSLAPACAKAPTDASPTGSAAAAASSPPLRVTARPTPKVTTPGGPEPCGALDCTLFDATPDAFRTALASRPLVLAIGETHAQKGAEAVRSTTSRFAEQLLPMLTERASDLVIELWVADPSCSKKQVAAVAEQQKEVTKGQAETNQNEFVVLAAKAKALGIRPHVLRPSCAEYDEILKAGPDGIPRMLTMIGRLTEKKVKDLLVSNESATTDRMVVTYGGAMHNDLEPKPGREDWSFAKALAAHTQGRYVEIDLIVPEYIKDNASWQGLPWYPHYEKGKHPGKTTLFSPNDGSYALVFPGGA